MSVLPPAPNGTMIVTFLFGQSAAKAIVVVSSVAPESTDQNRTKIARLRTGFPRLTVTKRKKTKPSEVTATKQGEKGYSAHHHRRAHICRAF
jgi:hypothetical protein